MRLLLYISITLAILILPRYSVADDVSPITPVFEGIIGEVGIMAALGSNYQTGTHYVYCEDCEFTDAAGFGFTIGLLYEKPITNFFSIGTHAYWDNQSLSSKYTEITLQELDNLPNEKIKVSNLHTADLSNSSIGTNIFAEFLIARFLVFRAGGFLQFPLNSTFKHEMELLTKEATLSNGSIVNISYDTGDEVTTGDGQYKRLIDEDDYPEVNSPIYGLHLSAGIEFALGGDYKLSPFFMYNLPLNEYSTYGEDFQIHFWRIGIEISRYIRR